MDEPHHGLDDVAPTAVPTVLLGHALGEQTEARMIVGGQEKGGINRRLMDGLAQECGCAAIGQCL